MHDPIIVVGASRGFGAAAANKLAADHRQVVGIARTGHTRLPTRVFKPLRVMGATAALPTSCSTSSSRMR